MKFLTTALVALFASNTVVGQTSGDYLAYGMGTTQCSEANQQFNKSQFEFTLSIWLTGYLTAINSVLSEQPVGLENSDLKDAVTAISPNIALLLRIAAVQLRKPQRFIGVAESKRSLYQANEEEHNK